MGKRDLFSELKNGFEALASLRAERKGMKIKMALATIFCVVGFSGFIWGMLMTTAIAQQTPATITFTAAGCEMLDQPCARHVKDYTRGATMLDLRLDDDRNINLPITEIKMIINDPKPSIWTAKTSLAVLFAGLAALILGMFGIVEAVQTRNYSRAG